MDFDINLVLVPVTLVFLLIWLADKFVFKQRKHINTHAKAVRDAKLDIDTKKTALQNAMSAAGISGSPEALVVTEETPSDVKNARLAHQQALSHYASLQGNPPSDTALVRWAYEFLPIFAVIVIVRSFFIEPFNIPSSSMVPSLYTGDFIIVNKSAYGVRLPITHTKVMDTGEPEHGDVAVFRYPLNEKRHYIKRVIGLPGDTVSFDGTALHINGERIDTAGVSYDMPKALQNKMMPAEINGIPLSDDTRGEMGREEERYARYVSETHGNHTYHARYVGDMNTAQMAPFLLENSPELTATQGKQWQITVPAGHYFVMGDNRDRSEDGRFWGFVPEANLSGKATYIWMHKEPGLNLPSFSRNGSID